MNCKKVILGGFVAGIAIIIIELIAHKLILAGRYAGLMEMGQVYARPALPYIPLAILFILCVGMLLAWLYAAARDTLHPGPLAAIKVGLAVGFITAVPCSFSMAAWSPMGKFVALVTFLAVLAECVIGTFLAAWLYQPKAAAAS